MSDRVLLTFATRAELITYITSKLQVGRCICEIRPCRLRSDEYIYFIKADGDHGLLRLHDDPYCLLVDAMFRVNGKYPIDMHPSDTRMFGWGEDGYEYFEITLPDGSLKKDSRPTTRWFLSMMKPDYGNVKPADRPTDTNIS